MSNKNEDYQNYIKYLGSKSYFGDNFTKEQRFYTNYFRRNYRKYLGGNRNIKILDIGCGKGQFLQFLHQAGFEDTEGIDLDPACVEFCKKQALGQVVQADLFEYLKDKQGIYDLIVLNDVIEHLDRAEILKFLELAYQALRPAGRLFYKTLNCNNIYGISSYFSDPTHQQAFTEEICRYFFSKGQFNSLKVYPLIVYPNLSLVDPLVKLLNKIRFGVQRILFLANGRNNKVFSKNFLVVMQK